jgi:hypothetical protein
MWAFSVLRTEIELDGGSDWIVLADFSRVRGKC